MFQRPNIPLILERLYLKRYAGAEQVRRIASLDVDGIKNALDCRLTPGRRLRRECIIIPEYVHNWEKLSALKSRGDIKNPFGC